MINDGEGGNRVRLCQHGIGKVACVGDRPAAQSGFDIGVGFIKDHGGWVRGARGSEERAVGVHLACAALNGGVIFDLTGHKNAASGGEIGGQAGGTGVIFRQLCLGQARNERIGAEALAHREVFACPKTSCSGLRFHRRMPDATQPA